MNANFGRILVVEDNEAERQGIVELLRLWGYRAKAVSDGLEALRELTYAPFDLVLSDLRMPRVSGAELLTELRQRPNPVTCIVISGEQNGLEEAMRLGADGFLAKPIDPNSLKAALEKYVGAQHTSEPPACIPATGGATQTCAAIH